MKAKAIRIGLALSIDIFSLQAPSAAGQASPQAGACAAKAAFVAPAIGASSTYEIRAKAGGQVVSILKRTVIAVKDGYITTRDTYEIPDLERSPTTERVVTEWLGLFSSGVEAFGQKFEAEIQGLDPAKVNALQVNTALSASGRFQSSFKGDGASGGYKVKITAKGCVPGSGARRFEVVETRGATTKTWEREIDFSRGLVLAERSKESGASMVLKE